ncbi:MAG: nucleoside triphosphate pyrophosphohydrolase [Chloroflexi bacterium]|nr:nucleoside triphosphate pyrophosphohydrolase [Chloroflexota bacterium]
MTITIVGLGPGSINQLTLEAWRFLDEAGEVYLRTARHPMIKDLPQNTTYHSFDELYDKAESFEALYQTIAEQIVAKGDVVYAVPGHPFVAEKTTSLIIKLAREQGIPVRIVEGLSFIEPTLTALGIDGVEGLQIHDALDIGAMHHPPLNPDQPAIIAQVYNRAVASGLKLTLMNQYADEYEVVLVHGAGTPDVELERVPLYEIDRSDKIAHLTSLYIPPMPQPSSFQALLEVTAHLRAPEGCPWDQEQTHESLRRYLLEEAHEVLETIDKGDMTALAEELGDLTSQVLLHTQIAVDDGDFYITDVMHHIVEKLIRRHPHVWGDVDVENSGDVVRNWESIKAEEKNNKEQRESVLDGIPAGLPALIRATRLQERAARVGFDWAEIGPVIDKIREEINEIEQAEDDDERAREFGDLLFAIVNWTRWLDLDAESLLRETNLRFYQRFRYIETQVAEQGRSLTDMTLDEMDALWEAAKEKGL